MLEQIAEWNGRESMNSRCKIFKKLKNSIEKARKFQSNRQKQLQIQSKYLIKFVTSFTKLFKISYSK